MTQYMPRSAWTTSARGGAVLTGTKLQGLACHWPGTTQNAYGVESASKVAARLRAWRSYHVSGRGWSDIGYNYAVDQAGRVWDLRGGRRVGAHCASPSNLDANHEWLGCLFILGDEEEPTPALIRAVRDFRHDVFLPRWPGRTRLTGHGRAPGVPGAQTSCPGPYVAAAITSGSLSRPPGGTSPEDDMTEAELLAALSKWAGRNGAGYQLLMNAAAGAWRGPTIPDALNGHLDAYFLDRLDPGESQPGVDMHPVKVAFAAVPWHQPLGRNNGLNGRELVNMHQVMGELRAAATVVGSLPDLIREAGDEVGLTPEQVEQLAASVASKVERVTVIVDEDPAT